MLDQRLEYFTSVHLGEAITAEVNWTTTEAKSGFLFCEPI